MDSGLKSQSSHNQTLSMGYAAIVRIRAILLIFIPLAYDLNTTYSTEIVKAIQKAPDSRPYVGYHPGYFSPELIPGP